MSLLVFEVLVRLTFSWSQNILLLLHIYYLLIYRVLYDGPYCVVPENIHTSPTEGLGNSEGEGALIIDFQREGGLGQHHNFERVF